MENCVLFLNLAAIDYTAKKCLKGLEKIGYGPKIARNSIAEKAQKYWMTQANISRMILKSMSSTGRPVLPLANKELCVIFSKFFELISIS